MPRELRVMNQAAPNICRPYSKFLSAHPKYPKSQAALLRTQPATSKKRFVITFSLRQCSLRPCMTMSYLFLSRHKAQKMLANIRRLQRFSVPRLTHSNVPNAPKLQCGSRSRRTNAKNKAQQEWLPTHSPGFQTQPPPKSSKLPEN